MEDKIASPARILAVDDDARTLDSLELILQRAYEVITVTNGEQALDTLLKKNVDLVFLDIHMPGGIGGLEVLKRIKDSGENVQVVMVTATNTAKTAVEAMKLGAFDYITKPFDPEEILVVAQKALENQRLQKEVVYFRSQVQPILFETLIGNTKAMKEVCRLISKVAPTDATVLIQGESGTGKELVARAIHFASRRSAKPLLALNCAGIPENLLETELFGHERGAFTGAERQKPGKFELANEGTLFLDEVSSLRLDMQGKILRVLQEREIERVGGTKTIKVNVRIVSATNVDLKKAIQEGKFRDDLFYRLNVIPMNIPPLRERKEDIPLLAQYFLQGNNKKFNKQIKGISEKAMGYLMNYPWPGNIRELENMVERLSVLVDKDVIGAEDLPFDIYIQQAHHLEAMMAESIILKDAVENFERQFITAVLEKTRWNQTEAAKVMGIHRNTLLMKKGQLGIGEKRADGNV
jgi:two-component system response regulator AtoC